MKNKILVIGVLLVVSTVTIAPGLSSAQMMNPGLGISDQTPTALSNNDYEKLGEQAMDLMMGSQHEAMDKAIEESMGSEFLKNMHVAMGKMSSGQGAGLRPWMPMMTGFGNNWGGLGMMSGWNSNWPVNGLWALACWIFGIALFVLIVLASWRLWQLIQKGRIKNNL